MQPVQFKVRLQWHFSQPWNKFVIQKSQHFKVSYMCHILPLLGSSVCLSVTHPHTHSWREREQKKPLRVYKEVAVLLHLSALCYLPFLEVGELCRFSFAIGGRRRIAVFPAKSKRYFSSGCSVLFRNESNWPSSPQQRLF